MRVYKTVALVILDGWGISNNSNGNAVVLANTVNFEKLWNSYPHTQLIASGLEVGLPSGEAGNTETGHLNLGAGRIVYQDLERINMSIADGSFFENPTLNKAFDVAIAKNKSVHLIGLIGSGGVHSNIEHLLALIQMAKKKNFLRLFIHIITDGRDSPPASAMAFINTVQQNIDKEKIGTIASIMGRYWAMDRDRRWDRTQKAYEALTQGIGVKVKSPDEAVKLSYSEGKTDEFINPSVITNDAGLPKGLITDEDSVIFFNFRVDRPRQLVASFVIRDFSEGKFTLDFDPFEEKYKNLQTEEDIKTRNLFTRKVFYKNLFFVTMTQYSKTLTENGAMVAYPPEMVNMPLGRVLSEKGYKQLRATETEKERFVTYYFNGQSDINFPNEDRLIIPSPSVATYDMKPEMSANELTDRIINALKTGAYNFIMVNFPNADMVGHTGNLGAAVKAVETVDSCLGKLCNLAEVMDVCFLVTADHGNVEEMIRSDGTIDTEHSNNPVPFIFVAKEYLGKPVQLVSGILADIAPTALKCLGIQPPSSMTGKDLLKDLV